MGSLAAKKFDEAASQTCSLLSAQLLALPEYIRSAAYEIRIRAGKPLSLSLPSGMYMPDAAKPVNRAELNDTFVKMCGSAIYSHQNEIASGCITLRGGHRVGICGRAVKENGRVINIADISSLCVRIAHEVSRCAAGIIPLANEGGIIIAGPPCSGKTTLLRDLALTLSDERNTVIIDERGEIAASYDGIPQLRTGCFCDVVAGFGKAEGMIHALRTLSPQVMICDEIGTSEEAEAVGEAFNSGVTVAVTMHCGSFEELSRRSQYRTLVRTGAFRNIVMLEKGTPGTIGKIEKI